MRKALPSYIYEVEPEVLDVWVRHHIRCWWIYTGKMSYEDYAKHAHVMLEMVLSSASGNQDVHPNILRDMGARWNKKSRMYEIEITRYGLDENLLNE